MPYPKNQGGTLLRVVLNAKALEKIKADFSNSTCLSLSEYARRILLGQPITVYYRSRSFDEFMGEAIILRKELQAILSKSLLTKESEGRLLTLVREIKEIINKMADEHVRRRKI